MKRLTKKQAELEHQKLMKKQKRLELSIKSAESDEKKFKKLRNELWKELEEKTEKLQKQLVAIEKPLRKKIDECEKKENKLNDKSNECERQIEIISHKKEVINTQVNGKFNEKSIEYYLLTKSVETSEYDGNSYPTFRSHKVEITEKKALPNGIQIFRVFDKYAFTEWFFFDGFRLVGYSFRRVGEHQGDSTTPYSFVGSFRDYEDALTVMKPDSWGQERKTNATFTDLVKHMKSLDPKKIKEINLNNEKIKETIFDHKGLRY